MLKNIPITELKPYPNNPRKNDHAVDAVAASIREFGFKVPLVIDKDGVIVAGHTRYKAAQKLGLKELPCIVADDLTDDQIKAFRLADNKTAELAEWDFELLDLELDDIELDMGDFGFDEIMEEPAEVKEDDYEPELPEEPKSKLGDIYQLGRHRLMCGDSTDAETVAKLMDGQKAQLLLTDPPYGISVVSVDNKIGGDKPFGSKGKVGYGEKGKNKILDCNEYAPIIGDDTTDTAKANYEIAKSHTDNQVIFGGNYFTDFLTPSRCWIVWDKQNTGNFADAELAWTSFDKGVKLYHFMWNGLAREGSRAVEGVSRVHPTQKPVGLFGYILDDFTEAGAIVLDCFGGSGSTLIACEQLNRTCYMMELDPHYCDVIIDRWEKLTGEKAELVKE